VFAFLRHMSVPPKQASTGTIRNGLNLPIGRYPEVIGDRAAAHMSLHLNRQCQRADALPPPVRFVPGIGCTDQEEARNERETLKEGRVRLLEGAYMCGPPPRQPAFLQFDCSWLTRLLRPIQATATAACLEWR